MANPLPVSTASVRRFGGGVNLVFPCAQCRQGLGRPAPNRRQMFRQSQHAPQKVLISLPETMTNANAKKLARKILIPVGILAWVVGLGGLGWPGASGCIIA